MRAVVSRHRTGALRRHTHAHTNDTQEPIRSSVRVYTRTYIVMCVCVDMLLAARHKKRVCVRARTAHAHCAAKNDIAILISGMAVPRHCRRISTIYYNPPRIVHVCVCLAVPMFVRCASNYKNTHTRVRANKRTHTRQILQDGYN